MLLKTFNLLKSNNSLTTLTQLGFRSFAGKTYSSQDTLGDQFKFPNHKEFFNDKYYEHSDFDPNESGFTSKMPNRETIADDYIDPNNPFVQENPFVPGGILANYKKQRGKTAQDYMEEDYWNQFKDIRGQASKYFDVVGKNEREMMSTTQNLVERLRLKREMSFSEDFRKRFMTREYGNYEKYDKNSVKEEVEDGADDPGLDQLWKNNQKLLNRLNLEERDQMKDLEKQQIEEILLNDKYPAEDLENRFNKRKNYMDHLDESRRLQNEMKFAKRLQFSEHSYFGRMSPFAKEELYRSYLRGMTIKDLSLKYGILPQRVKAIVFQKHLYWNEVYPKLGETHMRLALDREVMHASYYPFIDYGIDLQMMAECEKGVKLWTIKRSQIDANPPEEMKKKIEERLSKLRAKKHDFIPETIVGKGPHAYILKNWVIHRGLGAPKTSKAFREAIRLTGTDREHQLNTRTLLRMKAGGPRYAAFHKRQK